jgi:hypothetical protein
MNKSLHWFCASAALLGLSGSGWAADPPAGSAPAMHHGSAEGSKGTPTDEELIASAMKAAPKAIE